ncbi:uncharacterized protein LOC116168131 [Photinus pyralis]|uniref:uncharacterized protein LOC116168131 n=1 Tax=Photinus pyralis TaxID=7054 RepID=UPI0012671F11|nr:uncharacterized protein LOC116168131 [Photinus pyralis]
MYFELSEPPRSPSISPIEQVWDIIKRRLMNLPHPPQTLQALHNELEVTHSCLGHNTSKGNRPSAKMRCYEAPSSSSSESKNIPVKLPTIKLPTFSGNYADWICYYDTFNSLINVDDNLTNIQKFHYLKSSLTGSAAEVIASLGVSNDNYAIAWNLLRDRFENKRLIIKNHIGALINLPNVTKDSAQSLRQLLDTINSQLRALKVLNLPIEHWDAIIIELITIKFDFATNKEWESLKFNNDLPTLKEMIEFITHRCKMLESIGKQTDSRKNHDNPNVKSFQTNQSLRSGVRTVTSHATFSGTITCVICKQAHFIQQCPQFLKLTPDNRIQEIKKLRLCLNCLRENHLIANCKSIHNCKVCRKRHNSLLHRERNHDYNTTSNESATITSPTEGANETISNTYVNHCREITINKSIILLSTALVDIYDIYGNVHSCRALLDVGSQSNFISQPMLERLKLKTIPVNIPVTGIAQTSTSISKLTKITLKSRFNTYSANIDCLVIPKIGGKVPTHSFPINTLLIPETIKLADPEFHIPKDIDLLLGAELFWNLLCIGQIKLPNNQPYLQKTKLGWVIGGELGIPSQNIRSSCNFSTTQLENQLAKFWEIEAVESIAGLTKQEIQCEEHFKRSYSRNSEGRFIVRLPFKTNQFQLGLSKEQAESRFLALESKLHRNPKLLNDYADFIYEYQKLGHMEVVQESQELSQTQSTFYLPHHAVLKSSSLTTKLRVVFDGSAKSTTGLSLNDTLMVGPTIQEDLVSILIRFRKHQVAFVADIVKMYRQILIHPNDRDYLRILWRNHPSESLKTYRLCTVTYGTAPATFLAVRCLSEIAELERANFPLAHEIIASDFYVDDLITGADTLEQAIAIRDQVVTALSRGGFQLAKFSSNNHKLMSDQLTRHLNANINLSPDGDIKTLGLVWNSNHDSLRYSFDVSNTASKVTKRTILSKIAQIYDPLGLIGPILTNAKLILQQLWAAKINWDESISMELHSRWTQFLQGLNDVHTLSIPRNVVPVSNPITTQIHGFCDASQLAYGACVYVRSTDAHGNYYCHLLCGKSRVAPLKLITIPKLELCGAVLLAELVKKVVTAIKLPISQNQIFYWTDSKIVLAWLASPVQKWKIFVANRISKILASCETKQWRHVRTHDNPADLISRGCSAMYLKNSKLWFTGPYWLLRNDNQWPAENILGEELELPEVRKAQTHVNFITQGDIPEILVKYSSFSKLQRVMAYCIRFIHNTRKYPKLGGHLSSHELHNAKIQIIKMTQASTFQNELNSLHAKKSPDYKGQLKTLNPILDSDHVLRVGGRLTHANISYSQKHPIILPHDHHITRLIILYEHIKHMHAGPQATLAAVRQCYWPINGRNLVRIIIHKCVICSKCRPVIRDQFMGNLPKHRIESARPFVNCGIDYAGPIQIKNCFGRSKAVTKTYIALFICLSTKAIHVELVSDLTSKAFLNALKRLMARRGKISNIYSDNAKTFVGANHELVKIVKLVQSKDFLDNIKDNLSKDNITWHFIPPRAPHFGGLWEAGIKSLKFHLKRVVGNSILTFEEMYTVLTQIEACLNSRPLTPLSSNPDDLLPLTPAHFIIGESLVTPVEPDMEEMKMNRLSRYELIQKLRRDFWKRWSREYLSTLQNRTKWNIKRSNIQTNQLVILKEDNLPPLQWRMGRIIETHPGGDGVVRVVTIKTQNGVVKRSVSKVCVLPIE